MSTAVPGPADLPSAGEVRPPTWPSFGSGCGDRPPVGAGPLEGLGPGVGAGVEVRWRRPAGSKSWAAAKRVEASAKKTVRTAAEAGETPRMRTLGSVAEGWARGRGLSGMGP